MSMPPLQRSIYDALCTMPVIDTHEHIAHDEANAYKPDDDVLREYLSHYMRSDIVSAGLSRAQLDRVLDHDLPIAERWRIVEPYWEAARYTGYGQALDICVQAIYGIPGIHAHTIEALNDAFLAQRKPGHYARVLKEMCRIETCLLDNWTDRIDEDVDPFLRVWHPVDFFHPTQPEGDRLLCELEGRHGLSIRTLDDWLGVCEMELDAVLAHNHARVIKTACAYWRPLRFERVDVDVARRAFDEAMPAWRACDDARPAERFPRPLQDYMMHHILKLANERHLTFQIHTGLFEGNGGILLGNGDPSLLNPLFDAYPDVDFDLFHIGYPYQGKAAALAKMYPNVYIDMCWAHIISPAASIAALDDFLDAVPYTKISAFGGDYLFADGVYGHLELSRRNVSEVLARKVERGVFPEERAVDIGRALYYDNPKRIFKL